MNGDSCACGFVYYDARRQCWKCQKRPCSACGGDTGSVFIELCIGCAKHHTGDDRPYCTSPPQPPPPPVEPEPVKPKAKPNPKPKPKGKR